MKNLAVTLLIAGTALTLAACETGTTYDSGANYATKRTAGEFDAAPAKAPVAVKQERVFRAVQTK